ncbi:MAG: glutamine synthetase type III, partial [Lachnospiraceae bacterium]|nr:glutamine synthetase type III [Lachnospiraceae bacterium]
HRLGASEAPPAVISVFLGDELTAILEAIERDEEYKGCQERTIKLGVDVLPKLQRDTTDRNRTSPFAFTSNKFEFRMVGSSSSIAGANITLNSAVAKVLNRFADELQGAEDFNGALHALLRESIRAHKRIIFNGNGYDDAWIREATEVRGLSNYPTTPDARAHSLDPKNLELFTSLGIFTESEMRSRMEIHMENYYKTVEIEARTMVEMSKKEILPAVAKYTDFLLKEAGRKEAAKIPAPFETETIQRISALTAALYERTESLKKLLARSETFSDSVEHAMWVRDEVLPLMDKVRQAADELEPLVGHDYWPFPTYGEIFFGVH